MVLSVLLGAPVVTGSGMKQVGIHRRRWLAG